MLPNCHYDAGNQMHDLMVSYLTNGIVCQEKEALGHQEKTK